MHHSQVVATENTQEINVTETHHPTGPPTAQDSPPTPVQRLFAAENRLLWVAAILLGIVLVLFVWLTPGGLLGKADAVGYAVCHRIEARSFHFADGRQLPMCARCSGTFLGVLVGLFAPGIIFRRRRAGLFPPVGILAVLLLMSGVWAFDGANSFAHLLPGSVPRLYQPTNFLRLVTGMFHGITMGSLVLPVLNATLWADVTPERTIEGPAQLLLLYAIGAALIAMIVSGLAIFLYPLAVLSAAGTVSILTATNTVIVTTVAGQENRAHTLRQALPLILLGMTTALLLIGAIDALRFAAFGTWDGFDIPNAGS